MRYEIRMAILRVLNARAPGRNDSCPCGSGRKFKHCCAGKPAAATARSAPVSTPAPAELDRIVELRDAGRFLEAERLAADAVRLRPQDAAAHSALGLVHLHAARAEQAAACFQRAHRLDPNNGEPHYHMGFALEHLGRDLEAIAAFRRALALRPGHGVALERLGILLLNRGQRTEAIDCFWRVARSEPETLRGGLCRAKALVEEGRLEDAEIDMRATIATHPDRTEANRFLAAVLRQQGRFEEALPLLEQATEGSPGQAALSYYDLTVSKRVTEEDRPMLDQMQALLSYGPLQPLARMRVHYGLGKASDDLGDYAAAMRHFDSANRIAARGKPFNRAQFGAGVQRLIATHTQAFFGAHRDLGSSSELPVLILGMPRSGTTLVEQIVSSHPEIAGADELAFWTEAAAELAGLGSAGLTEPHAKRVIGAYEATLRGVSPDARRVTDKMPGNFLWIGLFHVMFPRGRIIHCRRHPVDTCLSNYFADFASPMPFTYDKGHLAFYFRAYERLAAHWRDMLPPDTLLEVNYEELVGDRERVTRRMIDFLGLNWDEACLRPEDNRREVKTASMWQARQPVYRSSTERWRRYEPWLGELATLLEAEDPSNAVEPKSDNPGVQAARRLREAGRFDEAIAALREALRLSPYDPVIYSDIGTLCLLTNRGDSALDCFENAIGLNPRFAVAHYNLGATLEQQGRGQEAIASLRCAIKLLPTLGQAHSRLGNLLLAQGEREEAMACFRRAGALLTSPADRDMEQAKLLLAEGRPGEAETSLRRAISLDPSNSLGYVILGDLLGEAGRFEEAVTMLRRATELDPDRVGPYHSQIVYTKISEADRPLLDRMEAMLARPGRSDFDRTLLHFGLGKAQDDLGDPAGAIRHFDQANSIEHGRLAFDRAAFANQVDALIETFTVDFFTRDPAASLSELPVFILGMPRSGTTLVEQILSAHSAVAPGGELTFWAERGPPGSAPDVDLSASTSASADYLASLRAIAPDAARITDKNPFNFLWIGQIHLALPQARILHCRRHPIDTCLSIYFTRFATSQPFAYDRGDLAFYYRQYARLMAHWRKVLPPDRLLEIDYEALTADPEQMTRQMIAFCGLDWDPSCLAPERNPRVVRTASVWQARQPVYRSSVERWRRYEPWLGELLDLQPGEA